MLAAVLPYAVLPPRGGPDALLAAATAAAPLTSYAWPAKNGDLNRTGLSSYVAPADLAAGPAFRWKSDYTDDIVRAAPLIDDEYNVYIATVTSGRVIKFAPTGKELWRYSSIGKPYDNTISSSDTDQINAVPALMDGSLFAVTANGFVVSIDMATGTERWRYDVHDNTTSDTFSMGTGLGVVLAAHAGSSDLLHGERAILALSAEGTKLWDVTFPASAAAAYNLMTALIDSPSLGAVAVFSDSAGAVHMLRLKDGTTVWSTPSPPFPAFTTGGAIVGPDDTIYVTSNVYANANQANQSSGSFIPTGGMGVVSAYHLADGRLKWRTRFGESQLANAGGAIGPLAGMGPSLRVVVTLGPNPTPTHEQMLGLEPSGGEAGQPDPAKVVALDAKTGDTVWTYTLPLWHGGARGDSLAHFCLPDESSNAAIGGDGVVYVPHEDGVVYAIKGDGDGDGVISDSEVERWSFDSTFQASPAIAPGMLAVAPCDGLAVFKL